MKNIVCHIVSVLYNCLNDQKENFHPHTSSAWCVMQKHIWGQSNAAWKQRSQPLEGYKIYLLSAFLFLLYLIKKAILLSHLLSDLPCQDPERAIHLSFLHTLCLDTKLFLRAALSSSNFYIFLFFKQEWICRMLWGWLTSYPKKTSKIAVAEL